MDTVEWSLEYFELDCETDDLVGMTGSRLFIIATASGVGAPFTGGRADDADRCATDEDAGMDDVLWATCFGAIERR